MKVVIREDESGVSEVIGTILILAITVVLFSVVIMWVSAIPTPTAQTRLDVQSTLFPVYRNGLEFNDILNLTNMGGESLAPASTVIYITHQRGNTLLPTDTLHLRLFTWNGAANQGDGLIDGTDTVWNTGERWQYQNYSMKSTDTTTITIVDLSKGIVLWTSTVTPPSASLPPVFVNVWATANDATPTITTPQSGAPFYIMAQIMSKNPLVSVYGQMTYFFGQGSCSQAFPMYDDGPGGGHGDQAAGDGIYTLFITGCMGNPPIGMDGSIVLFNATDNRGHVATSRLILHLVQGTTSGGGTGGNAGSGRPPNLRWNGNQGYNIFNATQWDQLGYSAPSTRTFKANETVVIVVGSLTLENVFGINAFNLWDPFSGTPQQAVVYGSTKTVTSASQPSTTQSFSFFQFVNGYYVYTYRFKLNDASVGTNYYAQPPVYPLYYYFAKYPLSMLLGSSTGAKFTATDAINITSTSGAQRQFPILQTFKDAAFTQPSSSFRYTDTMYVQVIMYTVELNGTLVMNNLVLGNVIIQDFSGDSQLWRAPGSPPSPPYGPQANLPICPPMGPCSGPAVYSYANVPLYGTTSLTTGNVYRFAINLARTNQDPWVGGTQYYSLSISSIKDSDETYGSTAAAIQVTAPLYKMDALAGVQENSNNAWGTKNYAFWFQDVNGADQWKPQRVDFCAGGFSTSGVAGSGATCPSTTNVKVVFGDFDADGALDMAESFIGSNSANPNSMVVIYRRGFDANGNIVFNPVFFDNTGSNPCTALAAGDVTGQGAISLVCGASNGWVWYYRNDGNWTKIFVDQPAAGQLVNAVAIGDFNGDGKNDIAVGGASGWLRWYPNLNGLGQFQNTGISDNWFAVSEQTLQGTIASGSYLNTYVKDGPSAGAYEQIQEALMNVPQVSGNTSDVGFDASTNPWTNGQVTGSTTSTQSIQSSGGNPGAFAQIQDSFTANNAVGGYFMQPFTVSGSPPYTVFLNLNYKYITASGSSTTFYAFVDSANAAPPQSPPTGSWVWTSGAQTSATGWVTIPQTQITKITAPGTYYLKIAMITIFGGSSAPAAVGGFDNVGITWTSFPGNTSAASQYWKMNTLPNRPGTAFTLFLTAHISANTDGDTFALTYATNVVGTNPLTGTYLPLTTVSATSDTSVSIPLPSTLNGATVWIRANDTNRVVGNVSLDILFVDQMYINANTPTGTNGVTLTNPGDTSSVNAISAGDQNGDRISDLVVGTANAHVFKYVGSTGGLITPLAAYYTAPSAVTKVKWGNMSTAYPGLDIVIAFGSTVRILSGSLNSGNVITLSLPSYGSFGTITALAVGDVNGDGVDDVVLGTSAGGIFYWSNLGGGTNWSPTVTIYLNGTPIYSLVIGDTNNAQYLGR